MRSHAYTRLTNPCRVIIASSFARCCPTHPQRQSIHLRNNTPSPVIFSGCHSDSLGPYPRAAFGLLRGYFFSHYAKTRKRQARILRRSLLELRSTVAHTTVLAHKVYISLHCRSTPHTSWCLMCIASSD